jgi:hypothetical protein
MNKIKIVLRKYQGPKKKWFMKKPDIKNQVTLSLLVKSTINYTKFVFAGFRCLQS